MTIIDPTSDFRQSEPRPEFPEHEKLKKVAELSQAIGEFIEFGGYVLAEWVHVHRGTGDMILNRKACEQQPRWCEGIHSDELWPRRKPVTKILADYFSIDLDKIDEEKRQMIDQMREANK